MGHCLRGLAVGRWALLTFLPNHVPSVSCRLAMDKERAHIVTSRRHQDGNPRRGGRRAPVSASACPARAGQGQAFQRRSRRAGRPVARLVLSRRCRSPHRQVKIDKFGGRWGDRQHLDKFLKHTPARRPRPRPANAAIIHRAGPRGRRDQIDHPGWRYRMTKNNRNHRHPEG